jgi:hypothetical protein
MLVLVDTRPNANRVIHGSTIMGPTVNPSLLTDREELAKKNKTGFYTIDVLISINDFTRHDFRDYYLREYGIDPYECIAVETNFRIGERVEPYQGMDSVSIAYLAIFNFLKRKIDASYQEGGVFASINQLSIDSFRRVGIVCELLMGRDDLQTPEEDEYQPVFIPFNETNRALFENLGAQLRELKIKPF